MARSTRSTRSTRPPVEQPEPRPPAAPIASIGSIASTASIASSAGVNLVVLWGSCSAGVEVRTLESGARLASLAVTTPGAPVARPGGRNGATSVPVNVWNPPAWLEEIDAGEPLVVVGTVRRRFFAVRGGGRGAKAEVEAMSIAKATAARRAQARQRAALALDVLT